LLPSHGTLLSRLSTMQHEQKQSWSRALSYPQRLSAHFENTLADTQGPGQPYAQGY